MADFAIEGLSAFRAFDATRTLTVGRRDRTNVAIATLGQDTVTLSGEAKALLAFLAKNVPFFEGSTTVAKPNRSAPGEVLDATLAGRDLSGIDLTGAVLNSADLRGTNFRGAVLRNASLADSDVTGASFAGADLSGANLAGVKGLTVSQLLGARIDSATILPLGIVLGMGLGS